MSLQFSLYLDIIRFLAAILVVLAHANDPYLIKNALPLSSHGHFAVVVFFVLSGYVIAYITDVKEKRPSLYWSSRLSRIYSVALPVILLTPLLDFSGHSISPIPAIYADSASDFWPIRVLASLFFLNEIWFNSIMSFSNAPFWSLCYEMSYYLIFSLMIFLKGKVRLWAIVISCLVIGPKILLLFPVWLMGVYLYRSKKLNDLPLILGWLLFIGSLLALFYWEYMKITWHLSGYLKSLIGENFHTQLAFSKFFLGDWIVGILVLLNFAAFRAIGPQFSFILNPLKTIIRYTASFTLTLYLFHQPLLLFFAALIGGENSDNWYFWQTMTATMVTIFFLGLLTEHRREGMRQWLRKKLEQLENTPFMQRLLA